MANKSQLMFDETARVIIANSADSLRSEIQEIYKSASFLKGLVQYPMPIALKQTLEFLRHPNNHSLIE